MPLLILIMTLHRQLERATYYNAYKFWFLMFFSVRFLIIFVLVFVAVGVIFNQHHKRF